jgi:hypothetical protein
MAKALEADHIFFTSKTKHSLKISINLPHIKSELTMSSDILDLEENIERTFENTGIGYAFLNSTSIAQEIRTRIDN